MQFIKNLFKRKRFDNTHSLYLFANKETAEKFASKRIEPNPKGSQPCRTCAGTGQALFKDIKTGKLSEDTCEDCKGKAHVFQFTESVYEI